MALSSGANICVSNFNPTGFLLPSAGRKLCCSFSVQVTGESSKSRRCLVRNSAEAASETPVEDTLESEVAVDTTKGFSSLISASNVEKALCGIAITSVNHYERLGIPRGTPYEQVTVAYKQRCEELQNKGLGEEELGKEIDLLKESHAILSSEEERRLYDWSLARSQKPDRYVWPFEVDITQTPTQPAPPQEPEDVVPTRVVGYVLLGWVILSFVLSITLNR